MAPFNRAARLAAMVLAIAVCRQSKADQNDKPLRAADCLTTGDTGTVAHVTDGMTADLMDGRTIRLAAIGVPFPSLSQRPDGYADASRDMLNRLVLGRKVALRGRIDRDRYGRYVAEATRDDGLWLQGEMLRLGEAWVATTPEQRDLAISMLSLESVARDARKGLWRARLYAIKQVAGFEHTNDSFAILEGQVADISAASGVSSIHFTEGSLVLRADHAALKRFSDAGIALDGLIGATLRVRGWPYWVGRPTMNLTHPEQIEWLQPAVAPPVRSACPG